MSKFRPKEVTGERVIVRVFVCLFTLLAAFFFAILVVEPVLRAIHSWIGLIKRPRSGMLVIIR